jgi:hypothetical protein
MRLGVRSCLLFCTLALCAGCAALAQATSPTNPNAPAAAEYEHRWLHACGPRAEVGRCPRELERGVTFPLTGDHTPEASKWPCTFAESSRPVRAALSSRRDALLECFEGLPGTAWVSVDVEEGRQRYATPGLAASIVKCAGDLIDDALQDATPAGVDLVTVVFGEAKDVPRSGIRNRASIRETIKERVGDVRRCYTDALNRWPALEGRLAVEFILVADGGVAIARSNASTLANPALECCITTAVRSWNFGKADEHGGFVFVEYPFVLEQDVSGP